MVGESIPGAGSLSQHWAVWSESVKTDAPPPASPPVAPREDSPTAAVESELAVLKAHGEALSRENELLRQRLAIADRQVEVKDAQINDFKAITENLSRQNQVLLMLAQGVPMERILKGGGQDIEVRPHPPLRTGGAPRGGAAHARADAARRELIASRLREHARSQMTQAQMAEALNAQQTPTLTGAGQWNRRRVRRAMNLLLDKPE